MPRRTVYITYKLALMILFIVGLSLLFCSRPGEAISGGTGVQQLRQNVGTVSVKDFGAKGDGVNDDTAAIQSALDSGAAQVVFPGGIYSSSTITVSSPGQQIVGTGGVLVTKPGVMSQAPLIRIVADNCTIKDMHLFNSNAQKSQSGSRNVAIYIQSNGVKITGNTIEQFLEGVLVAANGEWQDTIIESNYIKDVLGTGDGANNATSSNGEDRGDGITCWGYGVSIVNNIVTCKEGEDARVGIHVEALKTFEQVVKPYSDKLATITGNVVYGHFRRGIVTEKVDNTVIIGNAVAGASWWGIALSRANDCVASNNTILFDRALGDNSGGAWQPKRAGIMVYGSAKNAVLSNNAISVVGSGMGIALQGVTGGIPADRPFNITINDNQIRYGSSGQGTPIFVYRSDDLAIKNNNIIPPVIGPAVSVIYIADSSGLSIKDNAITSTQQANNGITLIDCSASTDTEISGNKISGVNIAITAENLLNPIILTDNYVIGANTGIDLNGCSELLVTSNVFKSTTNAIIGVSSGANRKVLNNLVI